MSDTLRITPVQTYLHWEVPGSNFEHFDKLLSTIEATDIIVLPEMFTTGFSMEPEKHSGGLLERTLTWMQQQAVKHHAVVTGSTMCTERGNYYNRLIWMRPDGVFEMYDKKHLFTYGAEPNHYTPGHKRIITEYKGWRICPLVCYDLRFPVWCRNTVDYDLLLFVANWPQRRIYAWQQLLIARAIENVAYVAGVNRIGSDGHDVHHSGNSAVIDYMGQVLWTEADKEATTTITLHKDSLNHFRMQFPALQDRDTLSKDMFDA